MPRLMQLVRARGKIHVESCSCQISQSQSPVYCGAGLRACLQPYPTKAEAWRNEPKYGRAAHSSDGSMQIADQPPGAAVGSPTEFVLWPMPTRTTAADCSPWRMPTSYEMTVMSWLMSVHRSPCCESQ